MEVANNEEAKLILALIDPLQYDRACDLVTHISTPGGKTPFKGQGLFPGLSFAPYVQRLGNVSKALVVINRIVFFGWALFLDPRKCLNSNDSFSH